jgi:hypothetical protein
MTLFKGIEPDDHINPANHTNKTVLKNIAIVRITFRFIRRIISLRSARTRKQKLVKENMSMAF